MIRKALKIITAAFLLVCCVSCGSQDDKNVVELSLDNYSQYLVVKGSYVMDGKTHKAEQKGTVYDSATLYATSSGVQGYKYYDVSITVSFDGKYYPWKEVKSDYYGLASGTYNEWIEEEYTFTVDNNGDGETSGTVKFLKPTADLKQHLNDVSYTVTGVRGKVALSN